MTGLTTDRRTRLADAAIQTLARAGMRGLTHRAVDQAAGLPDGSTSYYFRTRQSLLQAAVERLAELDTAELVNQTDLAGATDPQSAADAITELLLAWCTTGRERMLARYELALEANRREELRAVLSRTGTAFRRFAHDLLISIGAPAPKHQAHILVACLDGLIFDHLAGASSLDVTGQELRRSLRDLLGTFAAGR